jgi:hypothetical protein
MKDGHVCSEMEHDGKWYDEFKRQGMGIEEQLTPGIYSMKG